MDHAEVLLFMKLSKFRILSIHTTISARSIRLNGKTIALFDMESNSGKDLVS